MSILHVANKIEESLTCTSAILALNHKRIFYQFCFGHPTELASSSLGVPREIGCKSRITLKRTDSVSSKFSRKFFKAWNLPMQNLDVVTELGRIS